MCDIIAKLVIVGDQGVGKTSIAKQYIENILDFQVPPTVGASYYTTKVKIEGLSVELQIWDTAGQERFKAIVPMFYRKASAAIVVYDITRRQSFESVKTWITEIKRDIEQSLVFCVVGNKSDLSADRTVSRDEGVIYANSVGASYFECSAHTDQGVDQIFKNVARKLIRISGQKSSDIYLTDDEDECGNGSKIMFANASDLNPTDTGMTETASWSISSIAHGQTIGWRCC